jgi:hypothetical protein
VEDWKVRAAASAERLSEEWLDIEKDIQALLLAIEGAGELVEKGESPPVAAKTLYADIDRKLDRINDIRVELRSLWTLK